MRSPAGALRHLWLVPAVALVVVAGRLAFFNLGQYNDAYDQGVYLASAHQMLRGYAPYAEVFDSQPPLWVPLIWLSFRVFGENAWAGEVVNAIAGVATVVAVIAAAGQLRGWHAGLLAGALQVTSPLALTWSRVVEAEGPAVACAATAVALAAAYARTGRRRWLVAAAIAATAGSMVKLLGVPAFAALGVLVVARWWSVGKSATAAAGAGPPAGDKPPRYSRVAARLSPTQLRGIAQDTLLIAGLLVGLTLALALVVSRGHLAAVWDQAVTFHVVARTAYRPVSAAENWRMLWQFLAGERALLAALPLGLLCFPGGWRGLAALAWAAASVAAVVGNQPLFDHHASVLIAPLALAAGVGWGQLWVWGRRLAAAGWPNAPRWQSMARAAGIVPRRLFAGAAGQVAARAAGLALLAAGAMVLVPLWRAAGPQREAQRAIVRRSSAGSPDLAAAAALSQRTRPGDYVLADAQGIAFQAGRDVPPALADTSFVRIASRYLTAAQVIRESERYDVQAALLWTGRLRQMPEVVAWASRTFPHRQSFGNDRELYYR